MKKIKNLLSFLVMFFIVVIITYLFISLCNWNINISEWNGFSRFVLACEGIIFLIQLFDDNYIK